MENYDIIIIGGGPAGLTAGIYASRARMKTLLIERLAPGGQAILTELIENYPGFPGGIAGPELMEKMREQAIKTGLEIISGEVTEIEMKKIVNPVRGKSPKTTASFLVRTSNGVKTKDEEYKALAIIIASGAHPQKLGVPGEDRLLGKGVSYCATCDGPLFKEQDIVVVGGGDSAVEEALFLTKFAKKVILIHRRDRLRATKILQERALANERIEFILDSVVTEILGKKGVNRVKVKNKKTEEEKEIPCQGIFISIGITPATNLLRGLVNMDKGEYILTNEDMKTSQEGIYACGDCRKKLLRQIITACGEGSLAAFAATKYVEELRGMAYPGNSDR